jgi:hypothetical protein
MELYLKSVISQLKNYSLSLDKTSILVNKPWTLIDEDFEIQKIIFKKNKELILSKNGKVEEGKWDYFPEAKSLLIDRKTDKILCNEAFIDKGVLILKLDGTENKFFTLANENIIPDLNVNRYLKELRYQKLKIIEVKINDGRILEVQKTENYQTEPEWGNIVTINASVIKDGKYQLTDNQKYYEIKKGRIFKILIEKKYVNSDGDEIFIQQQDSWKVKKGDYIYVTGQFEKTSLINFTKRKNLIVQDNKVIRIESKNSIVKWFCEIISSKS